MWVSMTIKAVCWYMRVRWGWERIVAPRLESSLEFRGGRTRFRKGGCREGRKGEDASEQ